MVLCSERKMIDKRTAQLLRAEGIRLITVPESPDDGSFWHMNLLNIGGGRLIVDGANPLFIEQLRSLGFKTLVVRIHKREEVFIYYLFAPH